MKFFDICLFVDFVKFPHVVILGTNWNKACPWLRTLPEDSYTTFQAWERVNEDPFEGTAQLICHGTALAFSDPSRAIYAKLKWHSL